MSYSYYENNYPTIVSFEAKQMTRNTFHQAILTRTFTSLLVLIVTLGAAGELLAQDSTKATKATKATRMAVQEPQVISVAEVGIKSPTVSIRAVGKEVAPGVYQVDPKSIQGKRLLMPTAGSGTALVKVGVCIGVWHKKKERCIGIWVQNG